jgi:glycerol kinase
VQWLRDGLRVIGRAGETEALAAGIEDTGGVYLVPAFVGLGAPHWDPDARGAIFGLTRDSGVPQLVRAALESVAIRPAICWPPCRPIAAMAAAPLRCGWMVGWS